MKRVYGARWFSARFRIDGRTGKPAARGFCVLLLLQGWCAGVLNVWYERISMP
jgi:hypothetical protein